MSDISLDTAPFVEKVEEVEKKQPMCGAAEGDCGGHDKQKAKAVIIIIGGAVVAILIVLIGIPLNFHRDHTKKTTTPDDDPAQVHCLSLLGDHLGHVVYANTTQHEQRIWLNLCHYYWHYDPDSRWNLEAQSWYDGTADRILEMILKEEQMIRHP